MHQVVILLQTVDSVKKYTVKQKTDTIGKYTGIGNVSCQETAQNPQGTEEKAGNPVGQKV